MIERKGTHGKSLISVLTHTPTGFEFVFDFDRARGIYYTSFRPGHDRPYGRSRGSNWRDTLIDVKTWAKYVAAEIEAPDLWAAIAQEKALAASAASEENTPFTPEETSRLESAIDEIRRHLESVVEIQEGQAEYIKGQFEYLQGAIHRMGRRDWLHTAIGVLTTIVMAIGADQAQDLFQFAWQQISDALKLAKAKLLNWFS